MKKLKFKKGFTLIELIVVMAVIGILVLLAMPKFMGFTKKAHLTEIKSNIKQLENASERYYMDNQDWPRLTEEYYTSEQVESFAQEIKDKTGQVITLDTNGKYYDIDYNRLQKYVQKPKDDIHYILQNPVGEVFYLDGLTQQGMDRNLLNNPSEPEEPEVPILRDLTDATMLKLDFRNKTNSDANRTNLLDTSGNNINTILKNFSYTTASGWMQNGLVFDGTNDYIFVPTSANTYIKPTNELTVSVRVYRDNWASGVRTKIASITDFGGWAMDSMVSTTGNVAFFIMLSGDSTYTTLDMSTGNIPSGWHTFTATFDGQLLKSYMDGKLQQEKNVGNRTITYTRNNALLIGAEPKADSTLDTDYDCFKGKISDLHVYNKALTIDEIKNLESQMPQEAIYPEIPTSPNLTSVTMLELNFRDKTNSDVNKSTLIDTSGNNISTTLNNFSYTATSGWAWDGLVFDGTDDYVLVPVSANTYIKPTSQLTVRTRAYRDNWDTTVAYEKIYSMTEIGGWGLSLTPDYVQFGLMLSGDTTYTALNTSNTYLSSGWHTFTATFDGRFLKLYVDGELKVSKDVGIRSIKYTTNNALLIGAEPRSDSTPDTNYGRFKGKISDMSIYNKALSAEEIQILDSLYK